MGVTDTRWLRVIVYDAAIGTSQVVQQTRPGNTHLIMGHGIQMVFKWAIEGGPGDGRDLRRDAHQRMSIILARVCGPMLETDPKTLLKCVMMVMCQWLVWDRMGKRPCGKVISHSLVLFYVDYLMMCIKLCMGALGGDDSY